MSSSGLTDVDWQLTAVPSWHNGITNNSVSVLTCICACAILVAVYCFSTSAPNSHIPIHPGNPLYDDELRRLWGGPAPKHFQKAWSEWPAMYGVHGEGKIALVTGGTGGVGFYVAKLLARIGYEVVLPARSGLAAEANGSKEAILAAVPEAKVVVPSEPLNLESLASVRRFAAAMRQLSEGRLDLLCLNAGRGGSAADSREETVDGIEAIMQTNVISHFLLTEELLPLLSAAPAARIVSQTSRQRLCKTPGLSTAMRDRKLADLSATDPSLTSFNAFHQYQLSKACLCFLTRGLNARLEMAGMQNVVALVCEPGFAATGVNAAHDLAYSLFCLPKWLVHSWPCLTTKLLHSAGCHASDGALPMVMAATAPLAITSDGLVRRNDWYTPASRFAGEPVLGDPRTHRDAGVDPLNKESNWPAESVEVVWEQVTRWTGSKARTVYGSEDITRAD